MFHELEKKRKEVESERLRIQQERTQMLNNHNSASNAMTNDYQQKLEALANLDCAQLVKEKSLREEHEKLKAMLLDLSKQQEQLRMRSLPDNSNCKMKCLFCSSNGHSFMSGSCGFKTNRIKLQSVPKQL